MRGSIPSARNRESRVGDETMLITRIEGTALIALPK
jgi:hypothetical protein